MRSTGLLALFVAAAIVVAGCFGGQPSVADDEDPEGPPAALPPGCDANRTAVAHHPDGVAANWTGPLPNPCQMPIAADTWEPTIGIDPETGSVFFYPAQETFPVGTVGMARSDDGGATWTIKQPHLEGQPTHPYSVDPYMYLDPDTGRIFADDLVTAHCGILSFTDDRGESWTTVPVGCTEADHVNLFAGPPVTSTTLGYPNVVYRCAIGLVAVIFASFTSSCMKSLDGGMTFVNTGTPPFVTDPQKTGIQGVPGWCDGAVGHGTLGPDGTVYLPKGLCGTPMLAMSHDEGLTWERVVVSDLGMAVAFCNNWDHEGSVGVDPDGNVYYAWIDNQRVARLTVSTDGGHTWGPGMNVSAPGLTQNSMLHLAVGGVGKVAIMYMGSGTAPDGPFPRQTETDPANCETLGASDDDGYEDATWDAYLTVSTDALAASPTFLTSFVNAPGDPMKRGTCGPIQCGGGDFYDIRIGPDGTPWAALYDACTGSCAGDGPSSAWSDPSLVGRLWGGPSLLDADA